MLAVGLGSGLSHEHARPHTAGPADDSSDTLVVRCPAQDELAGILGVNADDHARLRRFGLRADVKVLREIASSSDSEHLGRDVTATALACVEGNGLCACGIQEPRVATLGVAAVGAPRVEAILPGAIRDPEKAIVLAGIGYGELASQRAVIRENIHTGAAGSIVCGEGDAGAAIPLAEGYVAITRRIRGDNLGSVGIIDRHGSGRRAAEGAEAGTSAGIPEAERARSRSLIAIKDRSRVAVRLEQGKTPSHVLAFQQSPVGTIGII